MKLKFVKLANSWYVHLPEYPGNVDELEMVCGADSMCYELDDDNDGIVEIEVYDISIDADIVLDFMFSTTDETGKQSGAYYNAHGTNTQQIWLCNVVKHIFKSFPPVIYIKKIGA